MSSAQFDCLTPDVQYLPFEIPLALVVDEPGITKYQFVDLVSHQELGYQCLGPNTVTQIHASQHPAFSSVGGPQFDVGWRQI